MKYQIVKALHQKYLGVIAEAEANVEIYLTNPAGIGEHPDVLDAIHTQLRKIAEAEHHIEVLQNRFNDCNSID